MQYHVHQRTQILHMARGNGGLVVFRIYSPYVLICEKKKQHEKKKKKKKTANAVSSIIQLFMVVMARQDVLLKLQLRLALTYSFNQSLFALYSGAYLVTHIKEHDNGRSAVRSQSVRSINLHSFD